MGIGRHLKRFTGLVAPRWLLFRGRAAGRKIALSFDDGPHPEHSPRILDVLGEAGVKVTFFVVGEEAEKYPALVRRMREEGHEVANHSYSHYGLIGSTPAEYLADVQHCQGLLEDICGCELARSFRPPYGTVHPAVFLGLIRHGYRVVLWSVDSDDSRVDDAQQLREVFFRKSLVPGDVVLLHEDYPHTLEALPQLLQMVEDRGFGLARCREL
ncbi:polysaccharide deacetylase family protein [Thiolapillus sp.]